tara:strand:+ start:639 stop:866 length:228 start_codon:yes stop_codon:yes gene_type:complete
VKRIRKRTKPDVGHLVKIGPECYLRELPSDMTHSKQVWLVVGKRGIKVLIMSGNGSRTWMRREAVEVICEEQAAK